MDQHSIAYKPLGSALIEEANDTKSRFEAGSQAIANKEVDGDGDGNGDGDDETLLGLFIRSPAENGPIKVGPRAPPGHETLECFTIGGCAATPLGYLRLVLCVVAVVLFLVFMFRMQSSLDAENVKFALNSMLAGQLRPLYSNYLASMGHGALWNDDPADDLERGKPRDAWWTIKMRLDDKYVTVGNYIRAGKSFTVNQSVTLSTQASVEFVYHAVELCNRWDGPISLAVFCPGDELIIAVTLIKYMRHCLPAPLSACIKDKVSWHLVYNSDHGPAGRELGPPRDNLDWQNYAHFAEHGLCPQFNGSQPAAHPIEQFESELQARHGLETNNYRQLFGLVQPINVARNLARQAAATRWTLALDIELYPSVGIVGGFVKMLETRPAAHEERDLFVLPIFEVGAHVTVPTTKPELVKLYNKRDANHCDQCHRFAHRYDWLRTDVYGEEVHLADVGQDGLVVFGETQPNKSHSAWEPLYVGPTNVPPFDERLPWEGHLDEMLRSYKLCLLNYRLLILGNAFLVHAPGTKHKTAHKKEGWERFVRRRLATLSEAKERLKLEFAGNISADDC